MAEINPLLSGYNEKILTKILHFRFLKKYTEITFISQEKKKLLNRLLIRQSRPVKFKDCTTAAYEFRANS